MLVARWNDLFRLRWIAHAANRHVLADFLQDGVGVMVEQLAACRAIQCIRSETPVATLRYGNTFLEVCVYKQRSCSEFYSTETPTAAHLNGNEPSAAALRNQISWTSQTFVCEPDQRQGFHVAWSVSVNAFLASIMPLKARCVAQFVLTDGCCNCHRLVLCELGF